MFWSIVLAFLFVTTVFAHPERILSKALLNCSAYPQVMSYHTHIVFMLTSTSQIEKAEALREEAKVAFKDFMAADSACRGTAEDPSGRYDDGNLCLIYDHPINETLKGAPFPVGEWSMWVPVHYYQRVVSWYVQHRGEFSLLVHPNTGCENEDHSIWAQWSGQAWPLDMSIFTPLTQTNEFDQKAGTKENPVCLQKHQVCGVADGSAYSLVPQVVCCSGLACRCADGSSSCGCA